jgi:hypothetical protein
MEYLFEVSAELAKASEILSATEFLRLFRSAVQYAQTGSCEEAKGAERLAAAPILADIEKQKHYHETRVACGKLGGRPKGQERSKKVQEGPERSGKVEKGPERSEKVQKGPSSLSPIPPYPPTVEKDNTNVLSKEKSFHVFQRPTEEQVRVYCQDRKNGVDAKRFLDYYDARGWILSKGVHVKDWHACVRTWERNHFDGDKTPDTGGWTNDYE